MNKIYAVVFIMVLVLLAGGGWYLISKNTAQVKNATYILETPRPNTNVANDFVIRGKARHTLDDLVFFAIYDAKYKNKKGTELGLNAGSIWIKDFKDDGYGIFEMDLKGKYPESSGQIVLELYTYDPGDTRYEKRINITKVPLVLERD